MKWESVTEVLREKGFIGRMMSNLEDHNMQFWSDGQRVIVLKEYRTESAFLEWQLEDQPIIGELYADLPSRHKNNLYFFMILNFSPTSIEARLEINRAQKDQYVCKKQILFEASDFEKIPFLNNIFDVAENFDFDEKFKKNLYEINRLEIKNEMIHYDNTKKFMEYTSIIINSYFDSYEDNENIERIVLEVMNVGNDL